MPSKHEARRGAGRGRAPRTTVIGLLAAYLGGPALAQEARTGGLEALQATRDLPLEDQLRAYFGDAMVAVVGEDVVTDRDVLAYIAQGRLEEDPAELDPDMPAAELAARRYEAALSEIIDQRLKTIGGRNLGFDPELVQRAVEGQVEDFIADRGGEQRAAQAFERMGITRAQLRAIYERRMLGGSWEATVTGRGPGATGRFVVDRFVRPGQRHMRYEELLRVDLRRERDPSRREEAGRVLGKSLGALTLRQLPVLPRDPGSIDQARANLEALRRNMVTGVLDFDEVLMDVAPPSFRGEEGYVRDLPPADLPRLMEFQHPGSAEVLADFLANPEPGAISPVLPIVQQGQIKAFTIYRVESFEGPAEARAFTHPEVQEAIVELIEEERADVAVRRGLARLARSTYLAPPEVRQFLLQRGRIQARRPEGAQGDPEGASRGREGAPEGSGAGAAGAR